MPKATLLFQFTKGLKPGMFQVPPVSWDGLNYNLHLLEYPKPLLALTNDEHIYFLDPISRKKRLLQAPLGMQQKFTSIAITSKVGQYDPQGRLFCCLACSDGTFAIIHPNGGLRERFCAAPPAPEYLGSQTAQIVVFRQRMVICTSLGEVWDIGASQGDKAYSYASASRGIALDPNGQLWIATEEPPTTTATERGCQYVRPPQEVKKYSGVDGVVSLVGVDSKKQFYWVIEGFTPRRIGEIVCTTYAGKIVRRVPLVGGSGIIPLLRYRDSQVDSVVVGSQGEAYVLCFDYRPGTKVGVYKVR